MQQNGVDADRFLYSVRSASPAMKEAPEKCFFLAQKFLQNREHEQAKRHVSAYLGVKERDPKAHRLLGLIFEKEGDVNKAVGCYKRSVDLDPRQKDVVLRVAELLCNLPETDSRADFWVDRAAKLLPNHPTVFQLKEKLLSAQGQRGRNQLFDLLKSQLKVCPSDPYINVKLVQLYCSDGQLKEAVDHCLAVGKKWDMRYSLDWYSMVTQTIQEYLTQPSVLSNHSLCSMLRRELLLAHCNLLRLTLFEPGMEQSVKALQSFDQAMQSVKMASGNTANGLTELLSELRGHLYLYAGTFFLKIVHNREYQKKAGVQLASLCYLLAYQIPRPKSRPSKGEPAASRLLDLLASDRKSQSGHMLLSLAQQGECFKEIVENLGNEPGKKLLFEDLFGPLCSAHHSFIANDNIRGVSTKMPDISDLEKLDSDALLLCGESLQQLTWLGLQLVHLGRRPCFGAWLKKLFPRHSQETFKLDSNATESICLLDLEVFLCGVVFTSPLLQTGDGVLPPCCLPLQIIGQLATERQSEWWGDACCFINRKVTLSNAARVQKTIQCGLDTLKGIGKLHGLQPALLIYWAQHLSYMGHSLRSCDKRAYIGRSVHYWAVVKPLLQNIKANRSIPIPLKPLFPHVRDKDIQVSSVVGYENEDKTVFAVLQDIKGNTEHAISILEDTQTVSAFWYLTQIFGRCSEEAANSTEKAEYLRKIRKYLTKVCQADAADLEKVQLPISMEELMDWLSEVRQQLGEGEEAVEDEAGCQELQPGTGPIFVLPEPSDPSSLSSRSLPAKSVASPSKRLVFSPKTPPQWAEDQTSMFQMLFQEMEALTNELHNWSGSMASANPRVPGEAHTVESHGESSSPAENLHGAPLTVATTGLSGYYSQPPAYNSQYLLRTATNVTPTKAPVYRMNSLPPQPRMYPHDQLYGAPLHFDQPAPGLLSPYGEDYYSHAISQSATNPTLPEPGYFTKSRPQPQPLKCGEEKFPDLGFGQSSPAVSLRAGVIAQSTPAAAFKFNSNFKSNDGDFTFSSAQAKNNESLRPLTSEMHIGTEGFLGEKRPNEDHTPGHSGIFSFGCKDSSEISRTSATQGPSNQSVFAEKEKPFTFTGMTKVMDRVDKANGKQQDEKGMESDNDSTRVEEDEDGPHFEPIIPLPDKVDVKTGEEEEEELFYSRAKLFRFETDSKEWKERGIGSVKILRHKTSGKVRLLMRRDQVLKICANHYITEDMELKLNAGSDRSWVWHAVDYADEIPKPEQLAIRFKTVEEAALFKGKFDQARMFVRQDQKQNVSPKYVVSQTADKKDNSEFGAQFAKKEGEWECNVCCIRNSSTAVSCAACQNANPNVKIKPEMKSADVKGFVAPIPALGAFTFQFGEHFQKTSGSNSASLGFGSFPQIPTSFKFGTSTESATAGFLKGTKKLSPKISSEDTTAAAVKPTPSSSSFGFDAQFAKKPGQWDCDTCSIMNEATASSCIACQAPNPNRKSLVNSTSAVKPASSSSSSGFSAQFTKKPGQWDCDTCSIMNEATATSCIACQAPNPNCKSLVDSTFAAKPARSSSSSGFGAQFAKKSGQWDCDTCALRNEATAMYCIACQAPNPHNKSLVDSTSAVKPASSSSSSGFSAQFTKKPGQWDCDTCSIMNEATATSCIACQAPNPNCKSLVDSTFAVKPARSSSSSAFGAQFTKKSGQWDCDTCAVRNEATAMFCIACQAPNPHNKSLVDSTSAVKPASSSSSSGFSAQFTKMPGQWDCDTCSIMNEATATSCIACQAPNPNCKSLVDSTFAVKPARSSSSSAFRDQFTKKSGQWDCDTCAVRNEATAMCCIACRAPNPHNNSLEASAEAVKQTSTSSSTGLGSPFKKKTGQWDCDTCAVRNEATATCCIACQAPNPCKKSSQWDCDICAVRNEASATCCISCQAPFKIQMLDVPWDCEKCLTRNESSSSYCVSCGTSNSSSKVKSTPLLSGFSLNQKSPEQFPRFSAPSTFKFGQADDKSPHSSKVEVKSATSSSSSGFSFSMPIPTGGFTFGIQEPVKEPTMESFPKNPSNESKEKEIHGIDVTKSYFPAQGEQGKSPVLHFKQYTLPLADLTRSSQGDFQFEYKDPDFKGFTQASEQVFTSLQPPVKMNSSVQDEDDMYKTEENDNIQFEPIVKMPEKVDLVTGEENEDVLYSQRVKLFRFDADSSQWKERGVGNLKFLKNKENGRLRVLMRREQVLKVCANHWINTTMNLKPLSGSDRAWMWLANDFSDGDAKPEQLAAKFKTPDLAKEFKLKFEECQKLLLDIPLQTPHKLIDSGRTAHLIQKAEKMKSGLKHLKSFLTDDKAKISQDECQVSTATAADTSRLVLKSNADSTIPTLEWEDYNLQKEPLHDSSEASLCASPSSNSPVQRALFRFGESTSDFNFSFQPIVTPTKSPSRVNQSRLSIGTDEESETTQEDDRDGQFFEPIVPLPDLVDISTGEENEQLVFIHRAKLFRYAKDLQQWKERGIGDIKILQNSDSKRVRLVMRRDQVLKLCANHWITSSMKLEPMKGAEKAWVWSAFDFAEGKGNIEQLAVRFKLQEVANSFKDAFEKAKDAQENKALVSPISPGEAPSQETLCQRPAAVMLKETSQGNLSHGSCTPDNMTAAPFMAHSHNSSAAVVSPPKFVFGSDSVQKIFGSPSSCTQNVSNKIKPKERASSPSFKISVSASQPSLSPMMPAFRVPEGGLDFRLFKDNPMAFWTSAAPNRFEPQVASESKGRTDITDKSEDVEDVQVVFVREPTSEQARLARDLLLPVTFFCYQNEPDYVSDDEDDDEDFETAVRKLNGKLYPSNPEGAIVQKKESSGKGLGDGVVTCEGEPVTELGRDECLQHPHTEADKGVQRREQLSLSAVSSSSDTPGATVNVTKGMVIVPESQPDSTSDACPVFVAGDSCPIDLSAKKSDKPDSTSKDAFSFGIQSVGGVSFADLAKSSGEYAFGKQDSSFTWANAGAAVFGIGTVSQRTEDEASDDAEPPSIDDVHFEPIVHLPEVEIKSGEEDEEVLFKARAKLYRWDRALSQWKERGVGDIKILCQPQKCYYRVLMRREQVLKVCANHTITTAMELKPMSSSSSALVWTATDYSEENPKVEQLAAKFKNEELAESFKKMFEKCQSRLTQVEPSQTPGHLEFTSSN